MVAPSTNAVAPSSLTMRSSEVLSNATVTGGELTSTQRKV
jgi:hypothetical protein